MPPRDYIIHPNEYDLSTIIADIEEIRRYNQQRVEMDSLDGSAVQRVPGRPVEQQCLGQSSLAQGCPEPPSCDILTIYGAKRALNPENQGY